MKSPAPIRCQHNKKVREFSYKSRNAIKDAYRDLKHGIDIRPLRCRDEYSIKGRVLIAYLVLTCLYLAKYLSPELSAPLTGIVPYPIYSVQINTISWIIHPSGLMDKKIIAIIAVVAVVVIAAAAVFAMSGDETPSGDIDIQVSNISVEAGETCGIEVKVTPSKYSDKVVITPASTDIYSYQDGVISGLKKGTSTIEVSVGDTKKSVNVEVTGIKITDSKGNVTYLDKPAERVVVYTKYMAEAFILMGATDKVVATSDTVLNDSNYAPYYKGVASAATGSTPTSADPAIQNRADLIILYSGDASIFSASNIPVLEIGASKLDEINADITALGKALGMKEQADKILTWFNKYYTLVTEKGATTDGSVKNAIESWSAVKLSMCGSSSTPGTLLAKVGGSNVFSGSYNYPEASTLIELNPDYYFTVMYNAQWTDADIQAQFDAVKNRAGWDMINAVQNKNVYNISNDIIGGIRGVIGGMFFLSVLNEDCADYDVTEIMNEYNALANTSFNPNLVYKMS